MESSTATCTSIAEHADWRGRKGTHWGEYTDLLRQAGFTRIEARRTSSPLDAILAVKE
jgi:hypothetical protein